MSLAMTAASIDNDTYNSIINNNQNESIINKKRVSNNHNKTQRRVQNNEFNHNKVNSVLESIHNRLPDEDDDATSYNPNGLNSPAKHSENFTPLNPLEPPMSVGGDRVKQQLHQQQQQQQIHTQLQGKKEGMTNLVPQPTEQYEMDLQELQTNFMNDSQVRDYYRKLLPNYNEVQKQNNNFNSRQNTLNKDNFYNTNDTNQVLTDKLNYVISLLEEQQDQRTNNVAEEVVLYSFLGVFIIFVADSFARAGKYVR